MTKEQILELGKDSIKYFYGCTSKENSVNIINFFKEIHLPIEILEEELKYNIKVIDESIPGKEVLDSEGNIVETIYEYKDEEFIDTLVHILYEYKEGENLYWFNKEFSNYQSKLSI